MSWTASAPSLSTGRQLIVSRMVTGMFQVFVARLRRAGGWVVRAKSIAPAAAALLRSGTKRRAPRVSGLGHCPTGRTRRTRPTAAYRRVPSRTAAYGGSGGGGAGFVAGLRMPPGSFVRDSARRSAAPARGRLGRARKSIAPAAAAFAAIAYEAPGASRIGPWALTDWADAKDPAYRRTRPIAASRRVPPRTAVPGVVVRALWRELRMPPGSYVRDNARRSAAPARGRVGRAREVDRAGGRGFAAIGDEAPGASRIGPWALSDWADAKDPAYRRTRPTAAYRRVPPRTAVPGVVVRALWRELRMPPGSYVRDSARRSAAPARGRVGRARKTSIAPAAAASGCDRVRSAGRLAYRALGTVRLGGREGPGLPSRTVAYRRVPSRTAASGGSGGGGAGFVAGVADAAGELRTRQRSS